MMDAMADCFVTSFSQDQIRALVRMQLSDLSSWDIQSYGVTGAGAKSTKCCSAKGQKLYVMKPDENSVNEAKALIAAVLGGEDKLTSTSQTPEKTDVHTPHGRPQRGCLRAGGDPGQRDRRRTCRECPGRDSRRWGNHPGDPGG